TDRRPSGDRGPGGAGAGFARPAAAEPGALGAAGRLTQEGRRMSAGYDPDLPILAELEEEGRHAAERALRMAGVDRGRGCGRVGRRALALVALAGLIGASALASTGALGGGGDPAVIGPALVARQGAAGGGYRLVLDQRGRSVCRTLVSAA